MARDGLLRELKAWIYDRGLPLPIDRELCHGWAREVGLPRGGDVILYTSCMYQMASLLPRLRAAVRAIARAPILARLAPLAGVAVSRGVVGRAYSILKFIVNALRRAGVQVGYLYEDEPYSGAILYEVGLEEEFRKYFRERVLEVFRRYGVRRVITVDPHTHNILVNVAPRLVGGLGIEVRSYLEYLGELRLRARVNVKVAVQDSCLYSRYLGLRHVYRGILEGAGVEVVDDPLVTGVETSMCCGGPIEVVDPRLSDEAARSRARQLSSLSSTIVTVCPLCLANLSGRGVEVLDISEVVDIQ